MAAMQSYIKIAGPEGYTTFADIRQPKVFFEESGFYDRCFGEFHRLYTPKEGNYCIRKQIVWGNGEPYEAEKLQEMVSRQLRDYMHDFGTMDRIFAVQDFLLSPVEKESPGMGRLLPDQYEVYMYVDRMEPFTAGEDRFQGDISVVYDAFNRLCTILENFYLKTDRSHNNINHHNIFRSGKDLILGNHSLCGAKNDIFYYNAPEILRGQEVEQLHEEKTGSEADIYSLGVWLYCLLRKDQTNMFLLGDRHWLQEYRLQFRDDLPEAAREVIRKAVSVNPADRYHTIAEMRSAMDNVMKKVSGRAQKRKKQKQIRVLVLALAVALLAGVGTAVGIRLATPSDTERITELIASAAYGEAYTEICALEPGGETDILIKNYIQSCRSGKEYQRIVDIIPYFSEEMFEKPEYLQMLFFWFREEKQLDILEPLLEQIGGRNDAIAGVIEDLYE